MAKQVSKRKVSERTKKQLDKKDIMELYERIAFFDVRQFLRWGVREVPVLERGKPKEDENGQVLMKEESFIELNESEQIDGQVIEEIYMTSNGPKLKIADRMKALEKLEKYLDSGGEEGAPVINVTTKLPELEEKGDKKDDSLH